MCLLLAELHWRSPQTEPPRWLVNVDCQCLTHTQNPVQLPLTVHCWQPEINAFTKLIPNMGWKVILSLEFRLWPDWSVFMLKSLFDQSDIWDLNLYSSQIFIIMWPGLIISQTSAIKFRSYIKIMGLAFTVGCIHGMGFVFIVGCIHGMGFVFIVGCIHGMGFVFIVWCICEMGFS